jgi:hypothetical protein
VFPPLKKGGQGGFKTWVKRNKLLKFAIKEPLWKIHYEMIWRTTSQAQRVFLIALSNDPDAKPFSKVFQLKHGIGLSSSIKASLDSLLKKGVVYKNLERSYRFVDRFMPYWIDDNQTNAN